MKDRNSCHHAFESTLHFSKNIKALLHVDLLFSEEMGNGLDTPMDARANYMQDILCLTRFFESVITDVNEVASINPFTGTDINEGDIRYKQPWELVARVADGRSAPLGSNVRESAQAHVLRYIQESMYKY